MPTYDCISQARRHSNENNDCAVVAVAVAADVSYEFARGLLRAYGKEQLSGTPTDVTTRALARIDWHTEDVLGFRGRSIQTVRKQNPTGVYLIQTKGHILCLRDGVIEDWSKTRSLRVTTVTKVMRRKCEHCGTAYGVHHHNCAPEGLLAVSDRHLLRDCVYALSFRCPHLFTKRYLCHGCADKLYGYTLDSTYSPRTTA